MQAAGDGLTTARAASLGPGTRMAVSLMRFYAVFTKSRSRARPCRSSYIMLCSQQLTFRNRGDWHARAHLWVCDGHASSGDGDLRWRSAWVARAARRVRRLHLAANEKSHHRHLGAVVCAWVAHLAHASQTQRRPRAGVLGLARPQAPPRRSGCQRSEGDICPSRAC